MILDLDALEPDGAGVPLPFAEVIESGAEVAFTEPVEGQITVAREGSVVWLRGAVRTGVTLTCARCARPFVYRLGGEFREGFRPGAGAAPERGPEEGTASVVSGLPDARLDVTEVVRQHLVIALPMAPVCRADCQGLCPTCGADRNEGRCGCAEAAEDPRLEPLRRFRAHPGGERRP